MNRVLSVIIVVLMLIGSTLSAQKIPNHHQILIDHLGNRYLLSESTLKNISQTPPIEYQNSFLGEISSVDISNPLRILVFFKNANAIVFLNNELSTIGEAIDLDQVGLSDVSSVCASNINGFWCYNQFKSRIEFYNDDLKLMHYSQELSSLINRSEDIKSLVMSGQQIYMNVDQVGILVFDMFGNYIKTLPIRNTDCFQVLGQGIIYTENNQALFYSFEKLEVDTVLKTSTPINYLRFYSQKLYYQVQDSLKERFIHTRR